MADEPKSIITKWMQYCMVCGKPREHVHHALYNTGKRKLADQDHLLIPLCQYHHEDSKNGVHNNVGMKTLSQALAEAIWEREYLADYIANLTDEEGNFIYSKDKIMQEAKDTFFKRYGEFYL